jgi:hypothetical protein
MALAMLRMEDDACLITAPLARACFMKAGSNRASSSGLLGTPFSLPSAFEQ